MKRTIGVLALLLTAAPVFAAECGPAAEYTVTRMAYRARPLEQALNHMLRGTPYRAAVSGKFAYPVKIQRASGPLSRSLDRMAAQTGLSWRQEGCLLHFEGNSPAGKVAVPLAASAKVIPIPAQEERSKPETQIWTLRADVPIHKQFAEWAQRAGWHFEWRLEKSWIVPAGTQFSGSFDEALAQAVEALYAQGKPVRLILWEGNRFAEVVDVDAK